MGFEIVLASIACIESNYFTERLLNSSMHLLDTGRGKSVTQVRKDVA